MDTECSYYVCKYFAYAYVQSHMRVLRFLAKCAFLYPTACLRIIKDVEYLKVKCTFHNKSTILDLI